MEHLSDCFLSIHHLTASPRDISKQLSGSQGRQISQPPPTKPLMQHNCSRLNRIIKSNISKRQVRKSVFDEAVPGEAAADKHTSEGFCSGAALEGRLPSLCKHVDLAATWVKRGTIKISWPDNLCLGHYMLLGWISFWEKGSWNELKYFSATQNDWAQINSHSNRTAD